MSDTYDPSDEPSGTFEAALAKQRLRKKLGLGGGLTNLGSTPSARMGHNVDEDLSREAARSAVDAGAVEAARAVADPDGLLSDSDVREVLAREGVEVEGLE